MASRSIISSRALGRVRRTYVDLEASGNLVRLGEGLSVAWPVGAGGKGNEGVAAFVRQNKNSIGYVDYGRQRAVVEGLCGRVSGDLPTSVAALTSPVPALVVVVSRWPD